MKKLMVFILMFLLLCGLIPESMVVYGDVARSGSTGIITRGERIPYPEAMGGGWATFYYYLDGNLVYCLEPPKSSHPSGTELTINPLTDNEQLAKVLYYGYGGPKDCTDAFMGWADTSLRYLFTHIAASYAYCGWEAFKGCTQEQLEACGVWSYIHYLDAMPSVPDLSLQFTNSDLKAYLDQSIQRTEAITLNGDSRNSVQITLPKGVTLHNITQNTTTEDKAVLYGGDSFYFSAPLTMTGDYKSGALYGSIDNGWKIIITSDGGTAQTMGGVMIFDEEPESVQLSVSWLEMTQVELIKTDVETENPLGGAVYGIYTEETCQNLLMELNPTDQEGKTSSGMFHRSQSDYYVKEILAPEGYVLDTQVYTVSTLPGKVSQIQVTDQQKKGRIEIQKHGEQLCAFEKDYLYEDNALEGAKFQITAAEDIYSPGHQAGDDENRTLAEYKGKKLMKGTVLETIITDQEGKAWLSELPLGTYQLEETEAPEGFVRLKEPVMLEIKAGAWEEPVAIASYDCINERQKVMLSLEKSDKESGELLEGAVFGVYADQDYKDSRGNIVIAKDTLIQQKPTDKEGNLQFDADMLPGQYYVCEIEAPKGYKKDETHHKVNLTGGQDEEVIEVHLEIKNEQEEVPKSTPTPTEAPKGTPSAAKREPVKTGDATNYTAAVLTAVLSTGVCIGFVVIKLYQRKKHSNDC